MQGQAPSPSGSTKVRDASQPKVSLGVEPGSTSRSSSGVVTRAVAATCSAPRRAGSSSASVSRRIRAWTIRGRSNALWGLQSRESLGGVGGRAPERAANPRPRRPARAATRSSSRRATGAARRTRPRTAGPARDRASGSPSRPRTSAGAAGRAPGDHHDRPLGQRGQHLPAQVPPHRAHALVAVDEQERPLLRPAPRPGRPRARRAPSAARDPPPASVASRAARLAAPPRAAGCSCRCRRGRAGARRSHADRRRRARRRSRARWSSRPTGLCPVATDASRASPPLETG